MSRPLTDNTSILKRGCEDDECVMPSPESCPHNPKKRRDLSERNVNILSWVTSYA